MGIKNWNVDGHLEEYLNIINMKIHNIFKYYDFFLNCVYYIYIYVCI